MRLRQVTITGPTVRVGKGQTRERFANDGTIHVELLGESWVAIWDDTDDEALLLPRERIKEARMSKDEILSLLTEPVQNGVAGAAKHEPVPANVAKAMKR